MKKSIASVLCFLFLIPLTLFSKSLPEDEQTLIVGTTSGYAPYVSLDHNGQYEGFDIDIANQLGKELNKKIIIKDFGSLPSLMMALKSGKVDVLIWAISITKERLEKFELVHYQGKTLDKAPFLFWGDSYNKITSISELEKIPNNIVCVEAGSSQESILKDFPGLKIKYLDKVLDVIMDLKYNKCLTASIDPGLIKKYQQKYPELNVVWLPIPKDKIIMGNGVVISQSNKMLANQIRTAMGKLKKEGKIAALEKKWNIEE